jgi:hypothetical protein
MSRYLKEMSAVNYRFKKFFTISNNYSVGIPANVKQVKSIIFGGGGCSCTYSICSCTLPQTGQCCCYCCVRGHYSGAGGGFAEKVWVGVGGQKACVCVGSAEGTSYVCFCNIGCVMATGGTSGITGTCNAGGYRIQCGGNGINGDVNTCGSPGYLRCTCYFCRKDVVGTTCCATTCAGLCTSICSCYYQDVKGVHLPGGVPGDSLCNKVAFGDDTASQLHCCCFYLCWGYGIGAGNNGGDDPSTYYYAYFNNYYCTKCAYTGDLVLSCTYSSVPGFCWAFPLWYCTTIFPQGVTSCLDPFYDFSWDVYNSPSCNCCRACCNSVGSFTSYNAVDNGFGTAYYYCCYYNCFCYTNRANESQSSSGFGSPGYGCSSPGQVGGGGAGAWNGDPVRSVTNYDRAGSCGLVILHY